MTLAEFVGRAITVPFKIGGRDWSGWDCWGLIFVAYRELYGKDIGSFAEEYDDKVTFEELNNIIARERSAWSIVRGKATEGDVSLYRIGSFNTHVGMVLPGKRLLHCEARINTVNEPLDTIVWKNRHVAFYRYG